MMTEKQRIVILGGGTAGWMTAAALARFLPAERYAITLVESEQIGTVGVGEATIPHIRQFNQWIGLSEAEFMQATGATYKLAIRFCGWGTGDSDYFHPFGLSGEDLNGLPFHQYWLWLQQRQPGAVQPFGHYSLAVLMAQQQRFSFPVTDPADAASAFNYAYHLDASLYAQLLSKHACARGVERRQGKVVQTRRHANGAISTLCLDDGTDISAELFIDCSGFAALLIGQALGVAYDNWQHWLPCDRAFAVPGPAESAPPPYTCASAVGAGWQWRIPLQHRTGNGLVFASEFLSADAAEQQLYHHVPDSEIGSARALKFVTGRRQQSWSHNCIAIGLSAGFLEPLESTSLYLIQLAIEKLLQYFPSSGVGEVERDTFNQQMELEYCRVRDFLILHYKLNRRPEPFWQHCAQLSLPQSLADRLALFKENGHLMEYRQGLFQPASWLAVLLGQGQLPAHTDCRLAAQDPAPVIRYLAHYQQGLQQKVAAMPSHQQMLTLPGATPPVAVNSLYGFRSR